MKSKHSSEISAIVYKVFRYVNKRDNWDLVCKLYFPRWQFLLVFLELVYFKKKYDRLKVFLSWEFEMPKCGVLKKI